MTHRVLPEPAVPADDSAPDFAILFVCTGNVCRSPVAERLAVAALGGQTTGVRVSSAGTRARVGSGVHPASATALAALGGDDRGFAARQLHADMVMGAHLTLTMTRRQRQEVLSRAPRAMSRTFTLREAADLLRYVPTDPLVGATPTTREIGLVGRLAAARARRVGGSDDDIRDPMGGPDEVHRGVAVEIARAVSPLMEGLRRALAATDLVDLSTGRTPGEASPGAGQWDGG